MLKKIKDLFVNDKCVLNTYMPTILMLVCTFIIAIFVYSFEVDGSRTEMLTFAVGVSLFEAGIMFLITVIEKKIQKKSKEDNRLIDLDKN